MIGSGSFLRMALATLIWLRPANGLVASDHLVENRAERKQIRPSVGLFALELFRGHVLDGADDCSPPSSTETLDWPRSSCELRTREAGWILRHPGSGLVAFAKPKSISLAPACVSMMLPGLRSRCTMPCRCAAVKRLRNGNRNLQDFRERQCPFAQSFRQRFAFEKLHHQIVGSVL